MPPKRKTMSGKTAQPTKKTRSSPKKNAIADPIKMRSEWFCKYKDQDDDVISPEGCQSFFHDIGVPLDSIQPLAIGWKLNASRMGYFTKDEWMQGLANLKIETPEKLKDTLPKIDEALQNEDVFKKLYNYTFGFAKTAGQKSMEVEVAIALWQLMLDSNSYPHIHSFIQFLQEEKPVRVINKDQWNSLFDFCRTVPEDLSNYDSTSSWPVLLDDYVEWRQKKY